MGVALTLKEKEHLTDNIWAFRFEPSEPQHWIAGQYISVELSHDNPDGKGTKRWFTISSAPFEKIIQITTRVTDSSFKQALSELPVGGTVDLLDEPHGDFVWGDTDKPIVLVAGGIGITSLRSILRQRAHENLPLSAQLIYGNRTEDIAFKEELDAYAHQDSNFTVQYIIGAPLTAARLNELVPNLRGSVVYISGPTLMAKTLSKDLEVLGLSARQFKQDFYPSYTTQNY